MSLPDSLDRAYSDPELVRRLVGRLEEVCSGQPERTYMEVCGTHTMAIFRHGVRELLPRNVRLISGPGCPVCVTPTSYLDLAIALARKGVRIATFGDLLRVPGSSSSLERERAAGAEIGIVYSPFDSIPLAESDPGRPVVLLGVGFETTTPAVAQTVITAAERGLRNLRVLSAHRRVVPALEALLASPGLRLDGFILPGHVSAVLGSDAYRFLAERGIGGVVTGFEPVDILRSLLSLAEQARTGRARVENQYTRVVSDRGNRRALDAIDRVFRPVDAEWRGLGTIPDSGLAFREAYDAFDALALLSEGERGAIAADARDESGCRCGEVLSGIAQPPDCPYFDTLCTPETPVGACMVSSEGTCAAWYRYGRRPRETR